MLLDEVVDSLLDLILKPLRRYAGLTDLLFIVSAHPGLRDHLSLCFAVIVDFIKHRQDPHQYQRPT